MLQVESKLFVTKLEPSERAMFVTRGVNMERQVGGIELPLEVVADFLNGKLQSGPATSKFREELLSDLSPLYEPSSNQDFRVRLEALTQKVNGLNLRARWSVKEVDRKLQVRRSFPGDGSFREWAYAVIMEGVVQNALWWLGRCRECGIFFVATDSRKKYCSPKCREGYHSKTVRYRVKKSRQKKRKESQRIERCAREEREELALSQLLTVIRLTKKANPTDEELIIIRPVLKQLGTGDVREGRKIVAGWDKKLLNCSPKQLFRTLHTEIKNLFSTNNSTQQNRG